jgi:NAD(P)-dependent dehydrogenase (short-subunit alcohol dehydrogenase family)
MGGMRALPASRTGGTLPAMGAPRRSALVTGAAGGLGQEFAAALAGLGHRVAGLDVADQTATAERIAAAGGEFLPVTADVTDAEAVGAAVEEAAARLGGLTILVNNAGIYPPIPFEATTPADWRRIMAVNLDAPFLLCRAVVPHLRAAGWGRIVNIVSAVVHLGPPDLVAYTASKSGLVGLTRALANALGPDGITVNAIAPGLTGTATAAATTGADGGFERVRALQAIPRTGEPHELTTALCFVCAEGSGFLTGQTITVDGGSAMH